MTDNLKQRIVEAINAYMKDYNYLTDNARDVVAKGASFYVLDIVEPIDSKGWFIPINEHWNELMQNSFRNMIDVIKHGGQIDVFARIDGKDYRWECDGLRHAKFIATFPTSPEKE